MKIGKDISVEFKGLYLVHQNLPGKSLQQIKLQKHILFIPIQGEIQIKTNEEYSLGPGHMLFLPENNVHSFNSSSFLGERLIVMIEPRLFMSSNAHFKKTMILPLSQLIKEVLFYLLLHPQTSNSKSLVSVMIETLAEQLRGQIQSVINSTDHIGGKIKDERVRKASIFMRENLNNKISIEEVAKQSGLSSRNLNRLMLNEIGLTPKQFLISARIEKAQELLLKPGVSVTEVALSVGYNSLSQFISAFRNQTGQLPSEVARFGRILKF